MDLVKDCSQPTRQRALNILKVLKLAASQPISSTFVCGYLGVGMSAAGSYLRAAVDAGALIRTGSYQSVLWIEGTDKDATERFIEKLKIECGLPTRQQAHARDMRRKQAEKEGRYIHYIDKAGQGPLEEVKPVARDPFDALFYGPAKVAA